MRRFKLLFRVSLASCFGSSLVLNRVLLDFGLVVFILMSFILCLAIMSVSKKTQKNFNIKPFNRKKKNCEIINT